MFHRRRHRAALARAFEHAREFGEERIVVHEHHRGALCGAGAREKEANAREGYGARRRLKKKEIHGLRAARRTSRRARGFRDVTHHARVTMGDAARPGTPDGDSAAAVARDKAKEIEREHLAMVMRRKHDALRDELDGVRKALGDANAARDKAVADANAARDAAEEARRVGKEKGEALERATRERDEARASKRELLEMHARKEREGETMRASIDGYVSALEAAVQGKNKAEADAREASARAGAARAENIKLESEVKVLGEHNAWLKEQLEVKSAETLAAKKSASADALKMAQDLEAAQSLSASQQRELARVKESASMNEARVTVLEEELKIAQFDLARNEGDFEKEVAKAQRIAEVSKEQVRERDEQIKALENTLRTAESTLAGKKTEFSVALAEATHAKEAALKELADVKSKASAAAIAPAEPTHRLPNAELLMAMSPAAGAAALRREGMSMTEVYTKYVEAEDALRLEQAQRRELQEHLDAILVDLEQKAPLIAEQREEYERALQSHQVLQARLQESEGARYAIQAELNAANVERRNYSSTINGFKAQSADLARQVALLLNEVNELKGCPPLPLPRTDGRNDSDAQAVITSRLVDFTDIQSLQAKNQEMLFVIRELSEAQESKTSDAREEYEQKLQELKEQTSRQLEELSNKRTQQENIVQAIVRQRDMYKTLYTSATGGGNGDASELSEHENRNSELVAISGGSGVAMMETNNELVALNKELTHDLDKLKRESTERIHGLQRQVDEHREAAATARGEANAAKAAADFERQRFERLDAQYSASQREVNALTEKTSSLSRANATHEAALRTQAANLDSAEERARNAQTQLVRLEAERAALMSEQTRLSEIVVSAEGVKAKLEASRDAALSLSSTREEEHKREHARLSEEVNRLQQDYSRVRSELDIERERSRQQLAAHAAASSEYAQRAASDVDLSAKFKEQTSEAEKRADIAEAKLEMLESTLARTEEKLRSASRMTGSTEPSVIAVGATGALTAAREQELLQAALKAGEAADAAKEAAEAEKKHTIQYKHLAEQSDSALKEMTKAFETHKRETAKETTALKKECAKLKKDAADSAKSVEAKLTKSLQDAEAKVANFEKLESDLATARADLERATAATKAAEERAAKAVKDVDDQHKKWQQVQSQYETEVAARKVDADKLIAAEQAKAVVEKSLSEAKEAKAKAERALAEAQAKVAKDMGELDSAKRAAETKVAELTNQNTLLHNMIEQSKTEATDSKSGEEGEVLRYLRAEKDAALAQVSTLTNERNAFQREAESARQEAESARQRLQTAETDAMGEEKHQSLLQKVEQLNAIEQTNSALRAEIDAAKADIAAFKKRETELTKSCDMAKEELVKAKAAVDTHDSEMAALRKEAKRWEERSEKLVSKYGEVDATELTRMKTELEATTSELATAKEELKSETTRADKAKSQLAISMKHIAAYNPEKTPLPQWRKARDEMEAKLAAFEAAAAENSKGASDLEGKLATAKAELDAANASVKEATEKAEKAEKASAEMKVEVEKLREAVKSAEAAAAAAAATTCEGPPATPAKTEDAVVEKAEDTMEEDKTDDAAAASVATPSSDRFKAMAQKKQAELMEMVKKLRETEDSLAAKDEALTAAINEKNEATTKCATLQKELDAAREKLKITEQLRVALEGKLAKLSSTTPAPFVPKLPPGAPPAQGAPLATKVSSEAPTPMAELASKAKDFVPSAKAQEPSAKAAPNTDAEDSAKAAQKAALQRQMDELRQKLDEKQAAATAGQKRKATDADDAPSDAAPTAKAQKTEAASTPAATPVDEKTDAAAIEEADADDEDGEIEDDAGATEDDAGDDDDAEEGELEGDDDAFVDSILVDEPNDNAPTEKATPGRGAGRGGGRGGARGGARGGGRGRGKRSGGRGGRGKRSGGRGN